MRKSEIVDLLAAQEELIAEARATGLRRGGPFSRFGIPSEAPRPPRPECLRPDCPWFGAGHAPHPQDFPADLDAEYPA